MSIYTMLQKSKKDGYITIREYIKKELSKGVASDEQLIDNYFTVTEKITWQTHAIVKKGESIRKIASQMRLKGEIIIVDREDREISSKIFYKLR